MPSLRRSRPGTGLSREDAETPTTRSAGDRIFPGAPQQEGSTLDFHRPGLGALLPVLTKPRAVPRAGVSPSQSALCLPSLFSGAPECVHVHPPHVWSKCPCTLTHPTHACVHVFMPGHAHTYAQACMRTRPSTPTLTRTCVCTHPPMAALAPWFSPLQLVSCSCASQPRAKAPPQIIRRNAWHRWLDLLIRKVTQNL